MDEVTKMLQKIDDKKLELNQKRPLTQGELHVLREEFLTSYTYNTTAIEGSTLTLQETALVLEGITIDKKPLKHHLEVIGHKDAFEYVEELIKEKEEFSEKVIKEIHSLVLMDRREDRGVYRRIPVYISNTNYQPPQPYLIPKLMEDLILKYQKQLTQCHIIVAIANFHIQFESIHPFIDGNGRTGRLLLNFELMKNGYLPIDIKFSDRRSYYDCFSVYHKCNDILPMVKLIANYELLELNKLLSIL